MGRAAPGGGRGLGGALLSGAGVLLAGVALRSFSVPLPGWVWIAVPAGALLGAFLPREPERELLWVGYRLGVGGRLAALRLLLARGEEGLAGLLGRELAAVRPRWARLFFARGGATLALALTVSLAAFLWVPTPTGVIPPPVLPPGQEEAAAPAEEVSIPEPGVEAEAQPAVPERMALPEGTPASLPLQDLLAEIYGLGQGEGPWATGDLGSQIQAQQGFLRKLSRELSRLASGGLSQEEQRTLLPMIQPLAREDLREELLQLVERGDEEAAQKAVQAVEAVREAGEELAQAAASPAGDRGGEGEAGEEPSAPRPALQGGDGLAGGGEEESQGEQRAEEEGELAGLAPGESGTGEVPRTPEGAPAQPTSPEVRPGEGPAWGYLAAGVPVEPEGQPPPAEGTYSPEEAELVLQGRGVPLELRGVVRRYFEILSQGGD